MSDLKASVRGLGELRAVLNDLKAKLRKQAVGNALSAAARVVRDDAKRRAPVLQLNGRMNAPFRKPGTVRNAIGVVRRNPNHIPEPGVVRVSVMVRPAKDGQRGAKSKHDPFYAPFLEFGTKFMSARPFMRPAVQKMGEALEVFKIKLASEIERLGNRK